MSYEHTFEILLDGGCFGEFYVDAVCRHEPGERGIWENGRQMTPDEPEGWDVLALEHPQFPKLTEAYQHDEYFRARVDEAVQDAAEGFFDLEDEDLPWEAAL